MGGCQEAGRFSKMFEGLAEKNKKAAKKSQQELAKVKAQTAQHQRTSASLKLPPLDPLRTRPETRKIFALLCDDGTKTWGGKVAPRGGGGEASRYRKEVGLRRCVWEMVGLRNCAN